MKNENVVEPKKLQPLKVDPKRMYTQKAYAKKLGKSTGLISQKVKANIINTIEINGGRVIYEKD